MPDADIRLCRECQLAIPAGARRCGHCGSNPADVRNAAIMAALVAIVILVLVAVNLAGR